MRRSITLKVGDKLRALVSNPFDANIPKGAICEIVRFGRENDSRRSLFYGMAPVVVCPKSVLPSIEWYTDVKTLFHNFKKESK